MTRDEITAMARNCGWAKVGREMEYPVLTARLERFAALVAEREREACAEKTGEFARKWWSIHCASNKHMETTRKAHDDFCALQAALRQEEPK
jgi:hypothetical protein